MADPEIVDVRRLRLNPGDVVVVKVQGHLSRMAEQNIKDELKTVVPDNKVLVVEAGVEIFTIGPESEIEVPE